ncbi:MAG: PaaI family thioesterase [Planctomycetales bacterium]
MPDSPEAAARHVPFLEHLEFREIERRDGRATFSVVLKKPHLRTLGLAHGGLILSLLDTVLGGAAGTTAPAEHYVVTMQLNANFIRPAWEGETLVASGEVRHSGRRTAVSAGEVRTAEGRLVATGSGTFMFLPHAGEARIERRDVPPGGLSDE